MCMMHTTYTMCTDTHVQFLINLLIAILTNLTSQASHGMFSLHEPVERLCGKATRMLPCTVYNAERLVYGCPLGVFKRLDLTPSICEYATTIFCLFMCFSCRFASCFCCPCPPRPPPSSCSEPLPLEVQRVLALKILPLLRLCVPDSQTGILRITALLLV